MSVSIAVLLGVHALITAGRVLEGPFGRRFGATRSEAGVGNVGLGVRGVGRRVFVVVLVVIVFAGRRARRRGGGGAVDGHDELACVRGCVWFVVRGALVSVCVEGAKYGNAA